MADRRVWSKRLIIGGGVAIGVGLLLRLSWALGIGRAGKGGTASGGQLAQRRACGEVWVRKTGPYFLEGKPTTISTVTDTCESLSLRYTGDAKHGDVSDMRDAIEDAKIAVHDPGVPGPFTPTK